MRMICQKPEEKRILGKYTLAWEDDIKMVLEYLYFKGWAVLTWNRGNHTKYNYFQSVTPIFIVKIHSRRRHFSAV